jgi:hypothetical protein
MTPLLTESEIAELERLLATATPGPWINGERITPEDNCMALQAEEHADIYRESKHGNCNVACATFGPVDADLVVALRNAAGQLLASAREANRLGSELVDALNRESEAGRLRAELAASLGSRANEVAEANRLRDQVTALAMALDRIGAIAETAIDRGPSWFHKTQRSTDDDSP